MWKRFKWWLTLFLRYVLAFGLRGVRISWNLHVGRARKMVSVPLPEGKRAWIRKRTNDALVYRQIFLEREADLTLFRQGASVIRKYKEILGHGRKPLVIGCGANNGLASIFFASLFPQAIVAAVEPAEENFELLSRNAELFGSIKPIYAGIWDTRTHLKVTNRQWGYCSFRTEECDESDPDAVAGMTIPDLLDRFPDCDPLLIKIDIEGAERFLFRSNTSWVDRMPLLIVELHDWVIPQGGISTGFLACVARMRCDFLIHRENVFVFNWTALVEAGCQESKV